MIGNRGSRFRNRAFCLSLALAACTGPASTVAWATVTYNDGAQHTIDTAVSGPVIVSGPASTTLDIVTTGVVNGTPSATAVQVNSGAVYLDGGTVYTGASGNGLYVQGGQAYINSGNVYAASQGIGVRLSSGGLTVAGGTLQAGTVSHGGLAQALWVTGGTVSISNGTFSGGTVTLGGGAEAVEVSGGTMAISGGTFVAGTVNEGGGAPALFVTDGTVSISNGTFSGGTVTLGGGADAADVSRGTVTVTGGNFVGGTDSEAFHVGGSTATIWGGYFQGGTTTARNWSAAIAVTETGVVDLYGGTVVAGAGLRSPGLSALGTTSGSGGAINVYGWGFNLPYGTIPAGTGTLTGYLADGSAINTTYQVFSNTVPGRINLIAYYTRADVKLSVTPTGPAQNGSMFTLTNDAQGGLVDSATINSGPTIGNSVNGTWSITGTLVNGAFINGGGGSVSGTVSLNQTTNILNNAVSSANLSFTVNAPDGATGAIGLQNYTLSQVVTGNVAPNNHGTQFSTPQTAQVLAGLQLGNGTMNGSLYAMEGNGTGTTGNTKVALLDSTLTPPSGTSLTMAFRSPGPAEHVSTSPPLIQPAMTLISDVIDMEFTSGAPASYVLAMNYNDSFSGNAEQLAAAGGTLFLAHLTPGNDGIFGTADDLWVPAVSGAGVLGAYQTTYLTTPGSPIWGVDTTNNIAWAIMPGTEVGQFAVVPEPASLPLFTLAAAALLRRRTPSQRPRE